MSESEKTETSGIGKNMVDLEGSVYVAQQFEEIGDRKSYCKACQHEVDAFERRLPTTNTESSSVVSDVSKETLAKLENWNKLPLHATLLEALRQSRNIKAPTPVQVAMINSFGSTNGNILLQAPFAAGKILAYALPVLNEVLRVYLEKQTHKGPPSAVLKPTVLLILPTNALATRVKAILDQLLDLLIARLNKTSSVQVGRGDIRLECHGAYGDTPWAQQQNVRISDSPHILVATPGRLLHLMRINKVAFTDLTTLVLDEANVLAGDEASWPELISQGDIVDEIGTLPIRRILVAPTRVSEHTDAGRRWLSSSYRSITTVSETDMTSLLHIASSFLQAQCTDRWSELYALFDTIVELLHKSTEMGAGLKNILVFLDTREETELLGKLIEYDGYVTLPFNMKICLVAV
ncbi:hypothetical protein ACHAQE_000685 [Botrytis cinerea]